MKFPAIIQRKHKLHLEKSFPISIFLFLILSGLSSSSWAQLTGALCDEGNAYYCPAGQVCLPDPGNDFNGYCCIPGNNCTASSECGSSNGVDSCGKPCTTATPGTCPAPNDNPIGRLVMLQRTPVYARLLFVQLFLIYAAVLQVWIIAAMFVIQLHRTPAPRAQLVIKYLYMRL